MTSPEHAAFAATLTEGSLSADPRDRWHSTMAMRGYFDAADRPADANAFRRSRMRRRGEASPALPAAA